jgi:hypothetical protein
MRNLKRALSLTLASVMLLGMMVMGSSALSFNDAEDISNVTAATVLEELEVMQGDGRGNFMPEQPVTRAQMAILVCRILYGDKLNVKQFEGVTQYTDVGTNDYYTGYINLATQLGIIGGYGDGRFGPDDTVTTAQAALMLSRALGYFKANELEGQDWALAAIAQATKIDMFGSLKLGTNELLARDNVAEMVFNTMTKAVPVMYSERWGVYYTDSQSLMQGVNFNYRNTWAYQNFDLVYNEDKTDDFERPATEWGIGVIKNGEAGIDDKGHIAKNGANIKNSIIKAVNEADATYTAAVKLGDIYKDLGLGEAVAADKVDFYRNGKFEDTLVDNKGNLLSGKGLTKGDDDKIGGNGVLVEVWYDSNDKTATVSIIDTFVGKVASVTRASGSTPRSISLTAFTSHGVPNLGSSLDTKFETENFAVKDVVAYTAAWNGTKYEIQTVDLLDKATSGLLTQWHGKTMSGDTGKAENDFTAGGTTYKYSKNAVAVDDNKNQIEGVWKFTVNESDVDVYLDNYGYAIYIAGVEGEQNYAAVIGVGQTNSHGDAGKGATLLFADGTTKAVDFKLKSGSPALTEDNFVHNNSVGDNAHNKGWSGDIVKYRVLDDGTYELNVLANHDDDFDAAADITFVNGKSEFKMVNNESSPVNQTLYTTSNTIFFVATKDGTTNKISYNAYTGYANAPGIDKTKVNHSVAYVLDSYYTTQINAVYLAYDEMDGVSSVDTYFVKKSDAEITHDSTGDYYVLPAVVDGEVTTVKVDASLQVTSGPNMAPTAKAQGVYAIKNVVTDKNGIITSATAVTFNVNGNHGTVAANGAVLGIGKNTTDQADIDTLVRVADYWSYTNSTKVYRVDKDYKSIEAIEIGDVYSDVNDLVYAKFDDKTTTDSKKLQDVFVVEVEDKAAPVDPVNPVTPAGVYSIDITNPADVKAVVWANATAAQKAEIAVLNEIIAAIKADEWTVADGAATKSGTNWTIKATQGAIAQDFTWSVASSGAGADFDTAGLKVNLVTASGTVEKVVAGNATVAALGTTAEVAKYAKATKTGQADAWKQSTDDLAEGWTYDIGYVTLTIDSGTASYIKAGKATPVAQPTGAKGTGFEMTLGGNKSYVKYGNSITPDGTQNVVLTSGYVEVTVAFKSGVTGWTVDSTSTSCVKVAASQAVSVVLTNASNTLTSVDATEAKYAVSGGLTVAETAFDSAALSNSNHTYTLDITSLDASTATNNITITVNALGLS